MKRFAIVSNFTALDNLVYNYEMYSLIEALATADCHMIQRLNLRLSYPQGNYSSFIYRNGLLLHY